MGTDNGKRMDWQTWEATHFRVTTFHEDNLTNFNFKEDRIWENAVGAMPKEVVSRPGESVRYEGEFEGQKLSLIFRGERVDWVLQPIQDLHDTLVMKPPTFKPIADYLILFQKVIEKWLASCPNVIRLAFGTNLVSGVSDRPEGYLKLSNYLPEINLEGSDFKDFLYQINRPRPSKLSSRITINRLIKWTVIQSQNISVRMGDTVPAKVESSAPWTACSLELDINTSPDSNLQYISSQPLLLLSELQNLGNEIALRGDVP